MKIPSILSSLSLPHFPCGNLNFPVQSTIEGHTGHPRGKQKSRRWGGGLGKRHQAGLGLRGGENGLEANSCCSRDLIVVPLPDQDTHVGRNPEKGGELVKATLESKRQYPLRKNYSQHFKKDE